MTILSSLLLDVSTGLAVALFIVLPLVGLAVGGAVAQRERCNGKRAASRVRKVVGGVRHDRYRTGYQSDGKLARAQKQVAHKPYKTGDYALSVSRFFLQPFCPLTPAFLKAAVIACSSSRAGFANPSYSVHFSVSVSVSPASIVMMGLSDSISMNAALV